MSLWTLWIEVLCAMMLSSAGGPSLAHPCRKGEGVYKEETLFTVFSCILNSAYDICF